VEQRDGALWLNEGSFSIRVEDPQARVLATRVGQPIVFGIRPENVHDARHAAADPAHVAKARVEVVEPMGAEVYLYFHTGRHAFIARVGTRDTAEVNQELAVAFDMRKAHFFDAHSGAALA
jgi:multiple sugar transport system ATP-binding protein